MQNSYFVFGCEATYFETPTEGYWRLVCRKGTKKSVGQIIKQMVGNSAFLFYQTSVGVDTAACRKTFPDFASVRLLGKQDTWKQITKYTLFSTATLIKSYDCRKLLRAWWSEKSFEAVKDVRCRILGWCPRSLCCPLG